MYRRTLLLSLAILIAVPAAAWARHLKVYSPNIYQETAVEYQVDYFAGTPLDSSGLYSREGSARHSLEFEYSISDRWQVGLYGDFEHPKGGRWHYVQTRLESIYRLFEPGERFLDAALYFEYEAPQRDYGDSDELEMKALLQKDIGRWTFIANPTFVKELDTDEGIELEYSNGIYYRFKPLFTPGIEFFGKMGEIGNFKSPGRQDHSLGPVVVMKLPNRVTLNAGVIFGLTPASDDVVLKSIIEYEF